MKSSSLHILTNGWGERLLREISTYLKPAISITGLRNDLGIDYHDYNTYKRLKENWEKFDVIHMNSWFDIFYLIRKPRNKRIIFESHALHPGLDNLHARAIIESPLIRFVVGTFGWAFSIIFRHNIKNADLYLVSTPGFLESAKKIRSDAKWFPNPIEIPKEIKRINTLGLERDEINIFYPTGLRAIKNPKEALSLLIRLKKKYPRLRIFMFEPRSISNEYDETIKILKENITFLPKAEQHTMREYYSHDWDLVIGSLYSKKPYAILNMIELESMAYNLPILAIDLYEILMYSLREIDDVAIRLIEDKSYRKSYTQKNHDYIAQVHAPERVAEIYQSLLESHILPQVSSEETRKPRGKD